MRKRTKINFDNFLLLNFSVTINFFINLHTSPYNINKYNTKNIKTQHKDTQKLSIEYNITKNKLYRKRDNMREKKEKNRVKYIKNNKMPNYKKFKTDKKGSRRLKHLKKW